MLPSPRTSDTNGAGRHGDGGMDLRTAVAEIPLLPTPAAERGGRNKSASEGAAVRWGLDYIERLLPTPQARDDKGYGPADLDRNDPNLSALPLLLPTPRATDGTKGGPNQRGSSGDLMLPSAVNLLPTPTAKDSVQLGGSTPSDITLTDAVVRTDLGRQENPRHAFSAEARPREELRGVRDRSVSPTLQERTPRGSDRLPEAAALLPQLREQQAGGAGEHAPLEGSSDQASGGVRGGVRNDGGRRAARASHRPGCDEQRSGEPDGAVCVLPPSPALAGGSGRPDGVDFGPYTPAIQRWEAVLGRAAPTPTKLSSRGTPKLSDEFDEFLMGLPAGWITDVPGITWNETLKACGNGVVPQQAVAALHWLRDMATWQAVAA